MFVQYSFIHERRQDAVGDLPVELTPALVTVLGIGAMLASTLFFVIG